MWGREATWTAAASREGEGHRGGDEHNAVAREREREVIMNSTGNDRRERRVHCAATKMPRTTRAHSTIGKERGGWNGDKANEAESETRPRGERGGRKEGTERSSE